MNTERATTISKADALVKYQGLVVDESGLEHLDPEERHEEFRRRITPPKDVDDGYIQVLVEQLLEPSPAYYAEARLGMLGDRAKPMLVAALKDPRITFKSSVQAGDAPVRSADTSPLGRVLSLLYPDAPPEIVPAMVPYLSDPVQDVRLLATLHVASVGNDASTEHIARVLAGSDSRAHSYAIIGIKRALAAKRSTPRFKTTIFDALRPLLERQDRVTEYDQLPECMLGLDRERATNIFLDARYLTADHPRAWQILHALNKQRVTIPADRLLPLLKEVQSRSDKYPFNYVYGGAVIALARAAHPEAPVIAQSASNSKDPVVRENAMQALSILAGVPNHRDFVFRRLGEIGYDGLTEPQRYYLAVDALECEVNNGGLWQFYYNSGGDDARDTLNGLLAIGATKSAHAFGGTMELFGKNGPSPHRGKRMLQLDAILKADEDAFKSFEASWGAEDIRMLLARYAMAHKRDFAP